MSFGSLGEIDKSNHMLRVYLVLEDRQIPCQEPEIMLNIAGPQEFAGDGGYL